MLLKLSTSAPPEGGTLVKPAGKIKNPNGPLPVLNSELRKGYSLRLPQIAQACLRPHPQTLRPGAIKEGTDPMPQPTPERVCCEVDGATQAWSSRVLQWVGVQVRTDVQAHGGAPRGAQ